MTDSNYTAMLLVIDRSGSMTSTPSSTGNTTSPTAASASASRYMKDVAPGARRVHDERAPDGERVMNSGGRYVPYIDHITGRYDHGLKSLLAIDIVRTLGRKGGSLEQIQTDTHRAAAN